MPLETVPQSTCFPRGVAESAQARRGGRDHLPQEWQRASDCGLGLSNYSDCDQPLFQEEGWWKAKKPVTCVTVEVPWSKRSTGTDWNISCPWRSHHTSKRLWGPGWNHCTWCLPRTLGVVTGVGKIGANAHQMFHNLSLRTVILPGESYLKRRKYMLNAFPGFCFPCTHKP